MAAQRSDTLIGDEVVRTLGAQGRLSQVLAQVSEGQVTLSGDVPDAAAKRQAEAAVAAIEGVRGVHVQPVDWESIMRTVAEKAGLLPRPEVK